MTRSQSGVVGGPQVVHDLHVVAGVDAGEVGEHLEVEVRLVVERAQHLDHVARGDPDLGLVVALADRPGQALAEAGLQALPETAVHRARRPAGTLGPIGRSSQWPRRSLTSCWSFIIP